MPDDFGLFEAIYTTRAIRKFKSDPVLPEVLHKVLEAATQGPSGINRQPWRFVAVLDQDLRRKVAAAHAEGYFSNARVAAREPDESNISDYLALHMDEAPVIILVCGPIMRGNRGPTWGASPTVGLGLHAAIFPAVQNLLLAARGLGLGGVLTLNHRPREAALKEAFGIPDDVAVLAVIPLGYPAQKHGPKTRMPVEEVAFIDRWGNPAHLLAD